LRYFAGDDLQKILIGYGEISDPFLEIRTWFYDVCGLMEEITNERRREEATTDSSFKNLRKQLSKIDAYKCLLQV
jgi:hypothetical protein